MKIIKSFSSNVATLILLLILGVSLIIFLSSRSQNNVTGQAPDTKPTTTQDEKKPTSKPDPGQKNTPTPTVDLTEPEDDRPEPTWTPKVILPEGTPPPLPSPPPTPTPTPINPRERLIAAFDSLVGGPIVSPDDQTLALVTLLPKKEGSPPVQILTINLPDNQIKRLDAYGSKVSWSPDGNRISYLSRQDDVFEVKIVNRNGLDKETLTTVKEQDFLDYYWTNSEQINIVQPDGIHQVDLTRRSTERVDLSIPDKTEAGTKSQVVGHPDKVIIVNNGRNLSVIRQNEQPITISDAKGRSIDKFVLSDNGQKLAYIVGEGPRDELWINNLTGDSPKMLYDVGELAHIHDLAWAPNGQAVVIGWRETGTSLSADLTLLWINVNNGKVTPLQIDGVDTDFVFNHSGDKLFYSRTFYDDPMDDGKTSFYQLEVKR